MKYRKNFKYALPLMLLVWLVFCTSSCIREEFATKEEAGDYSSVTIKVKMPQPTVASPMSRAVASDFDVMKDINIVIANGESVRERIYLDFANVGPSGSEITEGVKITYEDVDGFRLFHLHFAEEYWTAHTDIPLKNSRFYAVANWGSPVAVNTVSELRNLRVTGIEEGDYYKVATPNVMFGEIVREWTSVINPDKPEEVCRNLEIGLKRTAAMVTLQINGSGLDEGVVIDVQNVTLHNVPTGCTLGHNNVVTDDNPLQPIDGYVASKGEYRGGAAWSGGQRLAGTATMDWGDFAAGCSTTVGRHYENEEYENELVRPLFLYENIHGADFGADEADQAFKRPNGVGRNTQAIADNTAACSYIEINANYTRYTDNSGSVAEKGTAVWRFFLGGDAWKDFDVKRNTHYKLTLTLSRSGISETSWRVDTKMETPTVVGDPDMVVGGGGEMFCVELAGNLSEVITNGLKLEGAQAEYVYVRTNPGGGAKWTQVSTIKGNTKYETLDNKQLWFYVRPLLPTDKTTNVNERKCTVQFQMNNGTPVTDVSFTQYRPVTFSVTQADLDAYPDDEDLQQAKAIIEKYYNHSFATDGEFLFYADRVDREAMQWGFYDVQLDNNQNTGFENVYHLIDPPSLTAGNCQTHVDHAKNYLPTGRGWKEADGHIDYARGSCMMHAAMENYFQQFYPYPGYDGNGGFGNNRVPDLTLDELKNMNLPDRPSAGSGNEYTYAWCVPSIAGYQLLEKLDRFYKKHSINDRGFDPEYPITKWTSYWTSNAGTADLKETYPALDITGKRRSFAYQFDMGLDKIGEGGLYPGYLLLPRTSLLKYRLINIQPEHVNASGN